MDKKEILNVKSVYVQGTYNTYLAQDVTLSSIIGEINSP